MNANTSSSPLVLLRDGQRVQLLGTVPIRRSNATRLIVRKPNANVSFTVPAHQLAVHPDLADIGRRSLPPWRRLSTRRWMQLLDPNASVMVQVGANDHAAAHGNLSHNDDDPGPEAVRLGWIRSYIVEPMAEAFAKLERLYRESSSGTRRGAVNLYRSAVCGAQCGAKGQSVHFWSVDLSNASGNWGSDDSDGRCAQLAGEQPWLSEISSLSPRHILKHSHMFRVEREGCARCAKALNRPLPDTCMSALLRKNLVSSEVPCACLDDMLRREHRGVSLLLVDAEGNDAAALRQFPLWRLPVARISFEAMHMNNSVWDKTVTWLRQSGYECALGCTQRSPSSVWHSVASNETLSAHALHIVKPRTRTRHKAEKPK